MKKISTRIALAGALLALAAPGASALDHLLIIGDATPGGWSIDDGLLMVQDASDNNVYHYTGWLKADSNFKFTGDTGYNGSELEFRNASSDPKDISHIVAANATDNDWQFQVAESANYNVTVNVADLTVSAVKAAYQEKAVRFDILYAVGDATPGGWSLNDALAINASESNPFVFTITTKLNAGEFKFLGNPWANWGGPWLHPYAPAIDGLTGAIDYNRLTENNTYDTKWNISEAGTYTLTLNLADMTFACTDGSTSGIDNVSTESAGKASYYDLSGRRLTSPRRGTLCIEISADGTARKVRF